LLPPLPPLPLPPLDLHAPAPAIKSSAASAICARPGPDGV
jgi:hypothetical protein